MDAQNFREVLSADAPVTLCACGSGRFAWRALAMMSGKRCGCSAAVIAPCCKAARRCATHKVGRGRTPGVME